MDPGVEIGVRTVRWLMEQVWEICPPEEAQILEDRLAAYATDIVLLNEAKMEYLQERIDAMTEEENTGFTVEPNGLMEQVEAPGPTKDDEVTEEVYDNSQVTTLDGAEDILLGGELMATSPEAFVPPEIQETPEPQKVSICRMVEYRSRTGNYSIPAVVNCTTDSIYQPGVEHGFVPPLSAVDNVHLTVFTPGKPGLRALADAVEPAPGAENFVVPSPHPISENVAGCYQEWDIPYDPDGGPGTWRWPARV
jgi:hypothetical protein